MPKIIRLLLVDDHVLMRSVIVTALKPESDFRIVAQAATGEEACAAFREHLPDIGRSFQH